jgi:predicted transcriptional regulator
MEEEDLVEREGRTTRPTMVGFQFLQEHLQELGDFTYRAMREVNVINTCAAIAGEDLKEGDPVVLELEDGYIVARKGKFGSSKGVAAGDAVRGDDIAVRDLEGMLEFEIGGIYVVTLPSAAEGGSAVVDFPTLELEMEDIDQDVVAAVDAVGVVASRKLGLETDIFFGVDRATVDAALRGLDVLVLGARDRIGDVVDAIEEHNKRSESRIEYTVHDVSGS